MFGEVIANLIVLLVCSVTFFSLPLWYSESKKVGVKKRRRVIRKTP
jgi:hypothetical protein